MKNARSLPWSSLALLVLCGNNGQTTYKYDGLGRLVNSCSARPGEGRLTRYGFDGAGNRSRYANSKTDVPIEADTNLASENGKVILRMQSDGNLVVYGDFGDGRGFQPLNWSSNTVGSGGRTAYFQSDGNLVIYTASGISVWSSGTYGYPCSSLDVHNDGNVTIANAEGLVVWTTNTGGHNF